MDQKRSFTESLELLIKLFGELTRSNNEFRYLSIERSIVENFSFIADNFTLLKDELPEDLINRFGEPIHGMIERMIIELQKQLTIDNTFMEKIESNPDFAELEEDLKEIDFLLKNPDITEDQINELLDRREELKNVKHESRLKKIT